MRPSVPRVLAVWATFVLPTLAHLPVRAAMWHASAIRLRAALLPERYRASRILPHRGVEWRTRSCVSA